MRLPRVVYCSALALGVLFAASCRTPDRPGAARTLTTLFARPASCVAAPCVPRRAFNGRIDQTLVADTLDWMRRWTDAGARALVLEIDSQGGSIAAGLVLSQAFRDVGVPVHCLVTGDAHSMAFFVLQGCTTRAALPHATMMMHAPYVEGGSSARDLPPLRTPLSQRLTDRIAEQLSLRLSVSAAEIAAQIAGDAQWWLTPGQARHFGAVDVVVPSREEHARFVAAEIDQPSRPRS